jgi:uncharacterized damage-inducible protein DinB
MSLKFGAALAIAAVCAAPVFCAEGGSSSKFGQDFLKHWAIAKDLTIAVAQAMPADSYSFKPNPEEMSFGEQIVHIASANLSYCSRLGGEKPAFKKPDKAEQGPAIDFLKQSFDYCSTAVTATDPDAMHGAAGKEISGREIMLGAYAHMAHHRGQAEVYLRVKGVKPPDYKF